MSRTFRVLVMNRISESGLARLPVERYEVGTEIESPDAILLRSANLHSMRIPDSVRAIGRAGTGTNNIPVAMLSARGVPVFNTPGANANAVKELVLAAMLMAVRNLPDALRFVDTLDPAIEDMEHAVEQGKNAFSGFELAGQTLGVVGLGRVGCLVADAAIRLGMHVIGYDPEITVDAAWSLPSQVRKANSLVEVVRASRIVTLHVPLVPATRHLVNAQALREIGRDGVLLNFSREGVVDETAVLAALDEHRLRHYACDFPTPGVIAHPHATALPHLGASTLEAEENCARMVVDQLHDYLEHGNVRNSVNFPDAFAPRESGYRVAIANANVPNMLGQISTAVARAGLNIHNMLNKSRGDMAYTIVDVDSPVDASLVEAIAAIDGVLAVRYLPA